MKQQKTLCTIRSPINGMHDVSEVNAAQQDGWRVTQIVSDCASAFVYILEKGEDDK